MTCAGNAYGGFQQTLFLGCSVVSFSANAGWNQQSTEVTIELVEDTCGAPVSSPKVYWDLSLTQQTTTDPDPGFMGESVPIIGLPAYFRIGNFEFTGLIQSWERSKNLNGIRYIVKLVSPTQVLEDSQLIIGEYAGPVTPPSAYIIPSSYKPYNIINIYGYAEAQGLLSPQYSQTSPGLYTLGDSGPDGATFGTPAGGFGGSLINNNGMPWSMIKNIFNVLVNATPTITSANPFSPHGRILHKGADITSYGSPWSNGYGILDFDQSPNYLAERVCEYFIDLSELPAMPSYYRFNQTQVNILEVITRICQDAGYDFYLELLPVISAISPSGIAKFIKVRTVSRINAPTFGVLDDYINNAEASGILRGSSSGREFRNEIVSKFVVGGKKQTLYQAYQSYDPEGDGQPANPEDDDMILPYFGKHENGDMVIPYLDASGFWEFEVSSDSIEASLSFASFSGLPITINERELRASADQAIWAGYIINQDTDTNKALNAAQGALLYDSAEKLYHRQMAYRTEMFEKNGVILPGSGRFQGAARDFNALNAQAAAITSPLFVSVQEDTDKIYRFISNFATEYYGKKFAVRVPYVSVYTDPENGQKTMSEQPTQDGGWTEVSTVLGMPLNSPEVTFFRNDTNKIETIVAYTGFQDLDLSELDPESYVLYNNNLYLKGSVEPEYVFHDATGYLIPRAIVEIPSPITSGTFPDEALVHGMVKMANVLPPGAKEVNFAGIFQAYKNVGAKGAASVYHDQAFLPDAVAFGIVSNINTYGPWVSLGPAGGIDVEKNDGLVPWEYGGYSNLNTAGNALAQAGTTNMQVGEMGSVSIVGYPEIPLGAELEALTLLAGNQLVENRSVSTAAYNGTFADSTPFSQNYSYFDYGFAQVGANGPVVTNIAVSVGTEVSTQYSFRTYTPKFGRFARINAERLKEINQNRMQYVRDLRTYVRQNAESKRAGSLGFKQELNTGIAKLKNRTRPQDRVLAAGTPHELFVGQIIDWGDSKRTIISTTSFNELANEFDTEVYDQKSISSLESIIRPVSIHGAGGLPKLILPLSVESGVSGMPLSQVDFNPYVNPSGLDPSGFLSRRYNVVEYGDIGHDFDLVSRANWISGDPNSGLISGIPENGLLLRQKDGSYDYQDDYRTFALRGPLLLHSWGFDTNGKPIPNAADTIEGVESSGFTSSGLEDSFMSGFLRNPQTWPVAPVHLRLNRNNGMWEAGGLCTDVKCVATTSSTSADFSGNFVQFFQGSDAEVTGDASQIRIANDFNWTVAPGYIVYAKRGGELNDKYYAYQVSCP